MTKAKYKMMKFLIKDDNHCKEIQELLFKLGYKWESSGQETNHISSTALFVGEFEDNIVFSDLQSFHEESEYVAVTLEELRDMAEKVYGSPE